MENVNVAIHWTCVTLIPVMVIIWWYEHDRARVVGHWVAMVGMWIVAAGFCVNITYGIGGSDQYDADVKAQLVDYESRAAKAGHLVEQLADSNEPRDAYLQTAAALRAPTFDLKRIKEEPLQTQNLLLLFVLSVVAQLVAIIPSPKKPTQNTSG